MLKAGLVQFSCLEGQAETNKRNIEKTVRKYSDGDIDLLCFPELCVSGYDFQRAKESVKEKEFFAGLAGKYKIGIMAGVNVYEEGKYYDAACLWDEEGALLGEYRKIHLWGKENEFFEQGDKLSVIPFKGWKIGILLCADMRFFEVSTPLKNMGVDVIFYPSAWAYGWKELFHLCGRMRAAENQIYAIALNRASGDAKYCGGTAVMAPDGSLSCSLEDDGEGYLRAQLKKDEIQKVRDALAWESMKLPQIYEKYDRYRFAEYEKEDSMNKRRR